MNSVASQNFKRRAQRSALFMAGTMLAWPVAAAAQVAPPTVPASSVPAPSGEAAPTAATIKSINIVGNQRLEAQTILSYLRLRVGQNYDRSVLDQALKDRAQYTVVETMRELRRLLATTLAPPAGRQPAALSKEHR